MFSLQGAVAGAVMVSFLLAASAGAQQALAPKHLAGTVAATASVVTIHTIGDSTVQNYGANWTPRAGWGQVLQHFFDRNHVVIANRAVGGSSAKSYYDRYWASVRTSIKPGDYVTIGFGINDVASHPDFHTDPFTTFKSYLTLYVKEVKARGAYPIIVATQPRNVWTRVDPPRVYPGYGNYPVASRQLAAELGVPLIDLDRSGIALMHSVGQPYSTSYIYTYFLPGEWPNFPNGYSDAKHFQEMGAIELAKLVVSGIRRLAADPHIGRLIPHLKPTYPVTFLSNGADRGEVTRSEYFPAGLTITAYARPYAGFTFVSWNGDQTGTRKNLNFVMGTTAQTLTATFAGSPAVYQAEAAALSGTGTVVGNAYGGFNGSGYVDPPANGGTISFYNANGGEGGSRVLRLRYALAGSPYRTGRLVVNGAARNITFFNTGSYAEWAFLNVPVVLKSGNTNTIELKSTGADLANIDELTVR